MNKKLPNKQKSQIRIISGLWRGRKLPVLDYEGLRPTTDRVKETLFNWLMSDIIDAKCLDCFSGSGSLGFEALSRQAHSIVFLEKNPMIAKQLTQNILLLKTENARVINTNTIDFLSNNINKQQFDIIFLDPPFQQNLLSTCIQNIEKNDWLTANGLIYIESENNLHLEFPASWQLLKQKTAGQVKYSLLQKN